MVIVTGAAGFIGYQLAKRLNREGIAVIGVDELENFESRPEHTDVDLKMKLEPEAILGSEFYEKMIQQGTPISGIFHMGACSDTTETRVDYITRVNTEYTKTLWNRSIQYSLPLVYASSAATYGAGEQGYADDESKIPELRPLNLYGQSKQDFDVWALEQERTGKTPPTWSGFKFFNVYGFGERHKGRMASVVLQGFDQIRANENIKLFRSHKPGIADGEQERDFVFIDDVVNVLMFALQKPISRGIYNLGSGKARTFLDLAQATFHAMGKTPNITFIDTPVDIRDRYQYFTQATMERVVAQGYTQSMTSLEDGVTKYVAQLLDHKMDHDGA